MAFGENCSSDSDWLDGITHFTLGPSSAQEADWTWVHTLDTSAIFLTAPARGFAQHWKHTISREYLLLIMDFELNNSCKISGGGSHNSGQTHSCIWELGRGLRGKGCYYNVERLNIAISYIEGSGNRLFCFGIAIGFVNLIHNKLLQNNFWRQMHFRIVPPIARPILSVCPSVWNIRSTAKTVRDRLIVTIGSL